MTEWGLSMLMTVFVFDQILLFFVSLTDEMSVNRNPMVNEFRPLTDETSVYHRRSLDRAFLSFLLLTDISSVSDTEKSKNLRKNHQIH